jgi:hypothetical protein
MRLQITRREDDRELQTEQTIVRLPARKLQPDRMDALVVRDDFRQGGARVRCSIAVRFRRNAVTRRHNDYLAYHAAFVSLS